MSRALVFALLLVAGCTTPAILLAPRTPNACPPGFVDTSLPTSGEVRCEAPSGVKTHAMRPGA